MDLPDGLDFLKAFPPPPQRVGRQMGVFGTNVKEGLFPFASPNFDPNS